MPCSSPRPRSAAGSAPAAWPSWLAGHRGFDIARGRGVGDGAGMAPCFPELSSDRFAEATFPRKLCSAKTSFAQLYCAVTVSVPAAFCVAAELNESRLFSVRL
jgi:hypothetical protein